MLGSLIGVDAPMHRRTIIALLLMVGCASQPASTPVATIEQLLANPAHYDGREVSVPGYIDLEPEGRGLWTSVWAFNSGNPNTDCLTLTHITRLFPNRRIVRGRVVVRGIFRNEIAPHPIIDLGMCNERGIEVISVRR